jgi:serine/threonine protein kinase
MNPDLYSKASELFSEWVNLPPDQQVERLSKLENENLELALKVENLLKCDSRAIAESFLEPESEHEETIPSWGNGEGQDNFPSPGPQFGQYELQSLVGIGGMGWVYRALDTIAEREVAIKLIPQGAGLDESLRKRFRDEQISAARMSHPNIVTVYDVGTVDGYDYYTMELFRDGNLKDYLNRSETTPRRIAWQFLKIAKALDYAHAQGVIHRDIKPANILVSEEAEPMLTDFGIAKRTDVVDEKTSTGQIIGTLAYMAPEQLLDSKRVGPSADVYGLGATLYECLTGRKPFEGDSFVEVCDAIRTKLPKIPRVVRPGVDPELDKICMRCLQKEPKDRYATAAEVANDLERFLKGEPLASSDRSWRTSFEKFIGHQEVHGQLESSGATISTLVIAAIVHPTVFFLAWNEMSVGWLWLLWALWAFMAGLSSHYFHFRQFWQLTVIERQSGLIALLVNLSLPFLILMYGPLTTEGSVRDFLSIYPPYSLLAGVGLCTHAVFHSGKWILWGSVFFPLSVAMVWLPLYAPLLFCAAGIVVMAVLHRDLRRHAVNA